MLLQLTVDNKFLSFFLSLRMKHFASLIVTTSKRIFLHENFIGKIIDGSATEEKKFDQIKIGIGIGKVQINVFAFHKNALCPLPACSTLSLKFYRIKFYLNLIFFCSSCQISY